eukprot:3172585-Amphidinium_carterae.1
MESARVFFITVPIVVLKSFRTRHVCYQEKVTDCHSKPQFFVDLQHMKIVWAMSLVPNEIHGKDKMLERRGGKSMALCS